MITANFASQTYVFTNITSLDTVNENRTYYDSQKAFGYIITISSDLLTLGQSVRISLHILYIVGNVRFFILLFKKLKGFDECHNLEQFILENICIKYQHPIKHRSYLACE